MTGLKELLRTNEAELQKTKFNEERFKSVLQLATLVKEWRESANKMADGPVKAARIKNCELLNSFYDEYLMLLRMAQLSKGFVNNLANNVMVNGMLAPGAETITLEDIWDEVQDDLLLLNKIFE